MVSSGEEVGEGQYYQLWGAQHSRHRFQAHPQVRLLHWVSWVEGFQVRCRLGLGQHARGWLEESCLYQESLEASIHFHGGR